MFEQTHEACFNMCATPNDLTFLSIGEGKCLRNCFTKTGYMMPAVQKSLSKDDESGLTYQRQLVNQMREKLGTPYPNLQIYEPVE